MRRNSTQTLDVQIIYLCQGCHFLFYTVIPPLETMLVISLGEISNALVDLPH